jgi:hypothetical protein
MTDEKQWSLEEGAANQKPRGDAEPLLTPRRMTDPGADAPRPHPEPVVCSNMKGSRYDPGVQAYWKARRRRQVVGVIAVAVAIVVIVVIILVRSRS